MVKVRIRFRWAPAAIDYLLDLEESGNPAVAHRVLTEIRKRLGSQPGIYRFVRVQGVESVRARRLSFVQRLFLGRQLPYLVYFRYHRTDAVIEVLHIRHARQKPIEKP